MFFFFLTQSVTVISKQRKSVVLVCIFLTAVCDWKATLCLVLYQISIVVLLLPVTSVFDLYLLSPFLFSWQYTLRCMQILILNIDVFYVYVCFHYSYPC